MGSDAHKPNDKHDMHEQHRKTTVFGTGHSDNLEPLTTLDLSKVHSVNDMLVAMKGTAFGARTVGEAADVLEAMVKEKSCFKVLTLSGAMTVAKMGLVVCDMIDNGMVDCIISTGALMAHGFIESAGMTHFKYRPGMKDEELFEKGYDRVYDTIELESNLNDAEVIVDKILWGWNPEEEICSYKFNQKLGEYLDKNVQGRGVLKSAFKKNVPVYIPAFTDSEFGLDFAIHRRKRMLKKAPLLKFNPFLDLENYATSIISSPNTGIFTIGGGVPRNWGQQVAPYLDITNHRVISNPEYSKYLSAQELNQSYSKRFKYGLRICPEPVHWGGLSGSTYSEAISWGKFIPPAEGGKQVEVFSDATIAWPLIVKAVLERMGK